MAFEPIDVSTYIDEGAACFCGSRLSYASCHKNKIYKHAAEVSADQTKFSVSRGTCPFTEDGKRCGKPTITSHSIQRRVALSAISEQHHVIGFSTGPNMRVPLPGSKLSFQKVPISKASTFQGFCPDHDAFVFKELESGPIEPNHEIAIRLAIRAVVYEAIVHSNAALFLNWLVSVPKFEFIFDKRKMIPQIENMIFYSGYSWKLLNRLQKRLVGDRKCRFNFFIAKFEDTLPFACTGSFCIELDFKGRKLQKFSDFGKKFNYSQLTVLPQSDGTTILSVSALCDRDRKAAHAFIKSLSEQPRNTLADCALRAAIVHTENTYFLPTFISGLNEDQKNAMLHRFDDTTVAQVGLEKSDTELSKPLPFSIGRSPNRIAKNISK